jgi:DNA-binding response OmpR family regulator
MSQILVVDDEPEIRQLIRIHMEQAGLQIIEAESGRQAIEKLQAYDIELMILDLMMDDGNGFEVLHYMQENISKTLVIALSARRELQDKITTLGLGADDYVTKPFSPMELLARVQAHLRRYHPESSHQSEVIRLNKLILDADNFVLHNDGKQHALTPVECELLKLFMRNPDRVLTKREIYQHIWQHEHYDDNNLSVFISRLRKLLENSSGSQHHLHSVRGVGYRFSGDGL